MFVLFLDRVFIVFPWPSWQPRYFYLGEEILSAIPIAAIKLISGPVVFGELSDQRVADDSIAGTSNSWDRHSAVVGGRTLSVSRLDTYAFRNGFKLFT